MPEQTDRLTDRLTDRRTDRKVKTEGPKIMFIESRLRLTLIIGGPTIGTPILILLRDENRVKKDGSKTN